MAACASAPGRGARGQPRRREGLLAVILAAGEGRRLHALGQRRPKPMLRLLGLSLAERCVAALVAAGVRELVVVLGHQPRRLQQHFQRVAARRGCQVRFATASDWHLGNGASALAAEAAVAGRPFLLAMADHLYVPSLIRALVAAPPPPDGIRMAVDLGTESIFDRADLTKVEVRDGRAVAIGKQLRRWNAGDAGLFYCTPALFEGLRRARSGGRHELSDGIQELAGTGTVEAVEVTGELWIDIDTPAALREARRRLLASLAKAGEDGYISAYLNRPISRRISALLVETRLTPNQITWASFLLCLLGAALLALEPGPAWAAGGLTVLLASILDGCDGEVARLRMACTSRGAWLDTTLDRYADLAVALAVTLARARVDPSPTTWIAGCLSGLGFVMASYVIKEYQLRFGRPFPNRTLNRIKRRDLRLFVIGVGAILGQPYAALLLVGALSHLAVLAILLASPATEAPAGAGGRG